MKKEEIQKELKAMPEDWRNRWCSSSACACLGAANCSGQLGGKCSKEEYEEALKDME